MSAFKKIEWYTKKAWLTILNYSLWIASIGLSVFSAGIDGEWLSHLQPWPWMGYALNFTGDITGEVLMYQFCKMQRTYRHGSKRWRLSFVILGGALVSLWYSWLFSWRQLMVVLAGQPQWVAALVAAFVPALLGFIGYTQAIVEVKLDKIEDREQHDYERELKRLLQEQEAQLRKEFADELAALRRAPEWAAHAALERDGWRCFYCDVDMAKWPSDKIHVDHFYPLSKGGSDDPMNLVVSCDKCNLSKHAREPTADEIVRFKARLVVAEELEIKDKIHLLNNLGLYEKQKDIAEALGVSPSYISSVLRSNGNQLTEPGEQFLLQLDAVGKPPVHKRQLLAEAA